MAVVFGQVESATQPIEKGKIGNLAAVRMATTSRDRDLVTIEILHKLVKQAALSNAWLAFDRDKLAFAP